MEPTINLYPSLSGNISISILILSPQVCSTTATASKKNCFRSAWIGPRPSSSKENATTSMSDNHAFKSWLSKHKLTESEFFDCVKGQRPAKPFFPIQTSNIFPAKVLVLESNHGQAVQAGILVITKGPLENQLCIFEANSVFLHTVHFMHGDLSYIFKENVEKVTVETTEFSGGKERKKMVKSLSNICDDYGF